MKVLKKVLKWVGASIGSLLLLIILAGLTLRLFTPAPQPLGQLVDIGGFRLHINTAGKKSSSPTLIIEGGSGMATEYYHWLNEGLKDSMRVVRYDRAGIGYSDASNTPRDPETIAQELHALLEKAGESPPYILAGHSLGGPYIRVFTELYPDEVEAMFLLDATHPDRAKKIPSIPQESSLKFKSMLWLYDFQAVLGDFGVMLLQDKLMGPMVPRKMEGLPEEINDRTIDFLKGGKYIRTIGEEMEHYYSALNRAGETNDFDDLPIRVFYAEAKDVPEEVYQKYLKRGMDIRKNRIIGKKLQEGLSNLSTETKVIPIKGNHSTIFTIKENADIICKEIMVVLKEIES